MSYVPKEHIVVDQSLLTPGGRLQPKGIDPIAYLSQSNADLSKSSSATVGRLRLPAAPTTFACAMLMLLGTATIVLQIFIIVMNLEEIETYHKIGAGVWSGVAVFLTGTVGFMAIRKASRERILFFLVLSLTSVLVNLGAVTVMGFAIGACDMDWDVPECKTKTIISIVIACCIAIEFFCLLITILVSSQGFCCGNVIRTYNPSKNAPSDPTPTYVIVQQQPPVTTVQSVESPNNSGEETSSVALGQQQQQQRTTGMYSAYLHGGGKPVLMKRQDEASSQAPADRIDRAFKVGSDLRENGHGEVVSRTSSMMRQQQTMGIDPMVFRQRHLQQQQQQQQQRQQQESRGARSMLSEQDAILMDQVIKEVVEATQYSVAEEENHL